VMENTDDNQSRISLALRQRLLQTAREAVLHPFGNNENYNIDLSRFPQALKEEGASFVTLKINEQLRGCIGSLSAHRPLVTDVAHNAQAAAFKDPRFKPLNLSEYQQVDFHISVLSPPELLEVDSRADLLSRLRPGIDGLIIDEGGKRATYLPSVWAQLPDPESFVAELRRKAGLRPDAWAANTTIHRYTTEEFC
jgi:AmmeMemoRadiSam system protein A